MLPFLWTQQDAFIKKVAENSMTNLLNRITIDPHIAHGKPVIRGLRYPVTLILELLSAGMTIDDILRRL